jgi:hypothetical protein
MNYRPRGEKGGLVQVVVFSYQANSHISTASMQLVGNVFTFAQLLVVSATCLVLTDINGLADDDDIDYLCRRRRSRCRQNRAYGSCPFHQGPNPVYWIGGAGSQGHPVDRRTWIGQGSGWRSRRGRSVLFVRVLASL